MLSCEKHLIDDYAKDGRPGEGLTFCVVFTMDLCALESKQRSIYSLFEVIPLRYLAFFVLFCHFFVAFLPVLSFLLVFLCDTVFTNVDYRSIFDDVIT